MRVAGFTYFHYLNTCRLLGSGVRDCQLLITSTVTPNLNPMVVQPINSMRCHSQLLTHLFQALPDGHKSSPVELYINITYPKKNS